MRKVLYAALGAFIGSLLFAIQVHAQTPAQLPVMCGSYKALSGELTKIGEQAIGRGTNAGGMIVEFWLDPAKGSGTIVVHDGQDKACLIMDVEGFKLTKAGKDV